MAAKATEISCTAVTIITGISGYFSLERSSSAMPSSSAIIKSESMSSNSPAELRMARVSMPEEACRVLYPAWLSMEEMISRMGSSSSTTRMRSVAIRKINLLGGSFNLTQSARKYNVLQAEKTLYHDEFRGIQEFPRTLGTSVN